MTDKKSQDDRLDALMRDAGDHAFKPFFDKRVMARLEDEERKQDLGQSLWRLFPRVSLPAAATAVFFMAGNYAAASPEANLVEAVFSIPAADNALPPFLSGAAQP